MVQSYDLSTFKNLLAMTLREKPDSYLVEQLFLNFVTVRELLMATERELQGIRGVGPVRARQIASALQLARMSQLPNEELNIIQSPKDVFNLMSDMQYLDREHFCVLGLSTKIT